MNYESTIPSEDVDATVLDDTGALVGRGLLIAVAAVIALLVAFGAYYLLSGESGGSGSSEASQAPVVSVVVPGRQNVTRTINVTGSIAARREIPVGVVGEGGRVTNVFVDAGDWVKPGQIMASIDRSVQTQQAAGLAASVGVSRADLELAQSNLDRAAKLVERGFISKADIDRLTATRDAAAARLKVSQAQLNETRARNSRLNIVAPKGGFVLERNVEIGQTVTQGSGVLFRLAQNGEMELQAQLSESDLASVTVGVTAEVVPVGTDTSLTGQIWQKSPIIDSQTRQGIAKIALSYDDSLRPGGFASARIESGSSETALLPESAVQNDAQGSYVYIINKDNKVERREVTIGSVFSTGVSIASGLDGTEQVVLRAGGFLNPGELVRPAKEEEGK